MLRFLNPFSKRETRAQAYTDYAVERAVSTASGDTTPHQTAAREIVVGQWGKAFASAELAPSGPVANAVRPFLSYIGRELIQNGEALFCIEAEGGLHLLPANSYTLTGEPDPASWEYTLQLEGPTETISKTLPADRVLHLVYARERVNPWRGVGPLEGAASTVNLVKGLERQFAQEANGPIGSLIPVPLGAPVEKLQEDIRKLKGNLALLPSTSQGYGAGQTGAPPTDFRPQRIGANPPQSAVQLRREAEQSLLAACGVPVGLLAGESGTALREAYREFLHLSIAPVALAVGDQIGARFDLDDFTLTFDRLFASDLSGRARAFQSMVKGGIPVEKAAALAGLMEEAE